MSNDEQTYPTLHKALTDALDKAQPVATWSNKGHEFKILGSPPELTGTQHQQLASLRLTRVDR
jgi:hypothetical protein